MRVVLASDHNGVEFKERLKGRLTAQGHRCLDLGSKGEERVDYPDFAFKAAEMVARGEADRGVLICGTGIGMSIAANKVLGVRAALCTSEEAASLARRHNDANVITLSGWQGQMEEALRVVDVFMETEFEGGRHARRVGKIVAYEREHRK